MIKCHRSQSSSAGEPTMRIQPARDNGVDSWVTVYEAEQVAVVPIWCQRWSWTDRANKNYVTSDWTVLFYYSPTGKIITRDDLCKTVVIGDVEFFHVTHEFAKGMCPPEAFLDYLCDKFPDYAPLIQMIHNPD